MQKKAILVVSFGTSYAETRKKTIGAIEKKIQQAFPDRVVYRAFTSKIIKPILEKQGIMIDNVKEALERITQDGRIDDLIIQPTHIINGLEYDLIKEDVSCCLNREFNKRVQFGCPLLTQVEDYKELAEIIKNAYPVEEDEALVLMGHGSKHHANAAYPAFEYELKNLGYHHMFIATVEGYPTLDEVKKQLQSAGIKKVCLVPMMIVAGDHANNDMVGNENSWKSQLEQCGYQVRYYLKGLGELEAVQNMFIRHVKEALPD